MAGKKIGAIHAPILSSIKDLSLVGMLVVRAATLVTLVVRARITLLTLVVVSVALVMATLVLVMFAITLTRIAVAIAFGGAVTGLTFVAAITNFGRIRRAIALAVIRRDRALLLLFLLVLIEIGHRRGA